VYRQIIVVFTHEKNQNILGEIKTESSLTKILNKKKKLFCTVELNAEGETFKMNDKVKCGLQEQVLG
jgi:hypothetical protein